MALKLTPRQVAGLSALLYADALGISLPTGRRTVDDHSRWWTMSIHGRVAPMLEKLGLAKAICVLPDDTEVTGADLAKYMGHWTVKYRVTPLGKRRWKYATVSERCGLPELHLYRDIVKHSRAQMTRVQPLRSSHV